MSTPPNPNPVGQREFKEPVKWLAGRELLAGLKNIAAYSLMGDKLDPKDWMQAEKPVNHPGSIGAVDESSAKALGLNPGETYWFDFIADTGDGMLAVYNVACLCMSDLWFNPKEKPDKAFTLTESTAHNIKLPRGEFLFVGGDTAYHIADVASLQERFQTPFEWAHQDLSSAYGKPVESKPIYAIPANHDYYDAIDGYNRQFRAPFLKDYTLPLSGFEVRQPASYLALELPFKWQLWGFDSQEGKMDERQLDFFAHVNQGQVPNKLIVVTPEPITVFGKWQSEKADIVKTFKSLKIETCFLQPEKPDQVVSLDKNYCRLDLSGDIHHYERYWADDKTPNYASVVAGGGGAFLHPSHTDLREITRQENYPNRLESHRLSIESLMNFVTIWTGGFVWLAGALVGLLSYFAITVPQSTWSWLGRYFYTDESLRPPLPTAGSDPSLLSRIRGALDTGLIADSKGCCSAGYFVDLVYILAFVGVLAAWIFYCHHLSKLKDQEKPDTDQWLIGLIENLRGKLDAVLGAWIGFNDSRLVMLDSVKGRFCGLLKRQHQPFIKGVEETEWRKLRLFLTLPALVFAPVLLLWIFMARPEVPHSFLASLLIQFFVVAAVLLLVLSRKYGDLLNQHVFLKRFHPADLYPLWVFGLLAALYFGYGFLHYGIYPAGLTTFNLLIGLVWFLCIAGLPLLAYFGGAAVLRSKKEAQKLGLNYQNKNLFWLIGAWHAVLQVGTPLCLTLYATYTQILLVLLLALAVTFAARWYFTSKAGSDEKLPNQFLLGTQLLLAWVLLGVVVLTAGAWNSALAVDGWRLLSAGLLGAVFSCIWFGWYLAVSLAFNGHNNEAGGGASSDRFRHIIRFAVQADSLTGYVVGIDTPYTDDKIKNLKNTTPTFRLVDKFTIKMKDAVAKGGGQP